MKRCQVQATRGDYMVKETLEGKKNWKKLQNDNAKGISARGSFIFAPMERLATSPVSVTI